MNHQTETIKKKMECKTIMKYLKKGERNSKAHKNINHKTTELQELIDRMSSPN